MYGGSGGSPAGSPSRQDAPAPLAERLEQLDGAEPLAGAQPARRARECLPDPAAERFDEEHLGVAAGRALHAQAGGHDLRVVDDDELAVELVRQVGERPVADGARGALVDEQPRGVAPRRQDAARSARAAGRSRARPISSDGQSSLAAMDEQALERAKQRIAEARAGRNEEGRFEAALRRSREEVEALGAAALALEAAMPERIGEAVQEGLRREVLPVARNLAEIKGLLNNAIRRLERLEQDLIAERNARLDDLTLLVDLISSGWQGVDRRLERIERGDTAEIVSLRDHVAAAS